LKSPASSHRHLARPLPYRFFSGNFKSLGIRASAGDRVADSEIVKFPLGAKLD
jgi:hypothetical protein